MAKPKKAGRSQGRKRAQKQGKKVVGRTRTARTAKSKDITTRI
jgi:hypothetical protein